MPEGETREIAMKRNETHYSLYFPIRANQASAG